MAILRTLNVDDVLARQESGTLKRQLSGKDLVSFGIGIIIGTGIFTLAGVQAKTHAGPSVTLSFIIGAVVAGLAALCYAELASSVPTAGSAYTYAFATLGELVAWIIGWDLLLEFALGAAVVSRSWSGYLANLFGLPQDLFGEDATVNIGAVVIIGILTTIAVAGIRQSSLFTNALVIVKVTVCVLIMAVGVFFIKASNLTPFIPSGQPTTDATDVLHQPAIQAGLGLEQSTYGVAGMLTAAAIIFFSYTGFESLANLGEETKNPCKDLRTGIIGALVICALLYIGVSFVLTGMVPFTEIDEGAPLAGAFNSVGMSWVGDLISIGAITGLTSVMMVELVTIGRIGFAMGRDGLLPKSLGTAHPRWGTPHRVTIGGAVLIAMLAAFVPITELSDMVSIGALSAMIIVAIAIPVLRTKRPDLKRPFTVPLSPLLPILTAIACLYMMLNLDVLTWIRFAAWLALGLLIYFFYGRQHSKLAPRNRARSEQ